MGRLWGAAVVAAVSVTLCAPPASADPPPPGCERIPMLGLNPQIREICDLPIQADGSWERWRWFSSPGARQLNCRTYQYCPPGTPEWTDVPAQQSQVDKYIVTADTVPPGEPGYIGG